MSYLNYLCQNNVSDSRDQIIGTCYTLCPKEEIYLRKREKLVHILEVVGEEYKLVKSYSRSAADANMAVPRLLRPYKVLKDTVHYLLFDVANRSDVPLTVVYDFLNDRLRAVRQDMTIQRLPPEQCMEILEPIIRFHVYFAYRLCDKTINEFDPVLNRKYLLECIKWFLSCSDEIDKQNKGFNVDSAVLSLELLRLGESNCRTERTVCDRVLVESLFILCNMENTEPLMRYLGLPRYLKSNPRLKLAYEISISNLKGNYIRVCRLSRGLCLLTTCAVLLYLPSLQRRSLQVMSAAYNSKQLSVPTTVLQQWLLFNSVVDVTECCRHYGLAVDGAVRFNKTAFKCDVNVLPPKLNSELITSEIKLQNIMTY